MSMSNKRKSDDGSQPGKKFKPEEEDYTQGSFEDDLMLMAAISEESQSQDNSQQSLGGDHQDLSLVGSNSSWKRPSLPNIDPTKDTIVFQQMEVDYYTGEFLLQLQNPLESYLFDFFLYYHPISIFMGQWC